MKKSNNTFMGQVPNPECLVPGGRNERQGAILREDQVPDHALMAVEVKHSITWKQPQAAQTHTDCYCGYYCCFCPCCCCYCCYYCYCYCCYCDCCYCYYCCKEVRMAPAKVSPVNTFQIFMTPFSRPVASSNLVLLPLVGGRGALPFGALGPKARPHTGWPQLKLLSSRSVWPSWESLVGGWREGGVDEKTGWKGTWEGVKQRLRHVSRCLLAQLEKVSHRNT